jgi:glycosyltransferase involved in cell wall biosynthesis
MISLFMQQNFFISVIIPVFNTQKYIGRCLRSLKNQSISKNSYEIIVIDDCSSDFSLNEVKKQKNSNIKIIKNKKNLGLPASLNIGLKACKGSFAVRVDSDDWVQEDFLNIMSTFLYLNKNIDAVSCDYTITDFRENAIEDVNSEKKPIACGIMFRMQHLLDIGLYDEKFKYAEEEALRKKFMKIYKITRIPLSMYRYRQHGTNRSNNKKLVNKFSKLLNK